MAEKIERDFKKLPEPDLIPTLKYQAPDNIYVFYDIGKDWYLINDKYFNDINIKLNECHNENIFLEENKSNADLVNKYYIGAVSFIIGLLLGVYIN